MKSVTVLNGQTIFDIAVQSCGDVGLAYDIALMNGIDIFSSLEVGSVLKVPVTVNAHVAELFGQNKPTSKPIVTSMSQPEKVDITYSELLFLRNNGILQPGVFYCITDYITTSVLDVTTVANHRFNILVQAVTNYELSESAKVCAIAGDDYFSNSKLSAWKIMYCIDNDTRRFAWADAENGKGVIYYMCDENNNSAPYDFKNILFKGLYTFNLSGDDFSMNGLYCHNNEIRPYVVDGIQIINGNILDNLYEGDCCNNFFDYDCHDNYLVDNCNGNRFASGCYRNILYYNCNNNEFGIGCCDNYFEDSCSNNVFETGCCNNQFGVLCQDNRFGSSCSNNILRQRSSRNLFEQFCRYITIGRNGSNNRFGARCSNNSLGDGAVGNTFGSGCQNNILGNGCQYNSYGNYCMNISFRGLPDLTTPIVDYVHQCHISDGCSYIVICTRPSSSELLQNIMIKRGVSGTASEYMFIPVMEYNSRYEIMVALNTSGEIATYCEADLISQ